MKYRALFIILCFMPLKNMHGQEAIEHDIILIKDFVNEANDASWKDENLNVIEFGSKESTGAAVFNDIKEGSLDIIDTAKFPIMNPGRLSDALRDNYVKDTTIDIRLSTGTSGIKAVRGHYRMKLPKLKHIQLEVDYDIFLDDPEEEQTTDFYIEVRKENSLNKDLPWEIVRQIQHPTQSEDRFKRVVRKINDTVFQKFSYNAVLSDYADQDVEIVLVSESVGNKQNRNNGRWLNASLKGATFTFRIEP